MKTNAAGLALLKASEGCRLTAYPDPGTGGEPWTIGHGITSAAGVGKVEKGMTIDQAQADDMLARALEKYEQAVSGCLTREPTENQFAAMVSLAYNIGPGAFAKSSVVRAFNAGDVKLAADKFRAWNKAAGKTLPGLVTRRENERALFLRSVEPRE